MTCYRNITTMVPTALNALGVCGRPFDNTWSIALLASFTIASIRTQNCYTGKYHP